MHLCIVNMKSVYSFVGNTKNQKFVYVRIFVFLQCIYFWRILVIYKYINNLVRYKTKYVGENGVKKIIF